MAIGRLATAQLGEARNGSRLVHPDAHAPSPHIQPGCGASGSLGSDFNLHTIVRLPNGVFAPYTSIPTNLLFFERSGPTKDIWYYEQPLPEGRKNYTKTQPIRFEEFAACQEWWKKRKENGQAWKVAAKDVVKYDEQSNLVSVNLDIKNPNTKQDLEHLPPDQLADSILKKEQRIAELMGEIKQVLAKTEI